MTGKFRRDVAVWLAQKAANRQTVTYGELAREFGGLPMGWGPALSDIVRRLKRNNLPLLPVLVVSAETDMPSAEAAIYQENGIRTDDDMLAEQKRCWDFDWSSTPLLRG
jgi:hypothetical protein